MDKQIEQILDRLNKLEARVSKLEQGGSSSATTTGGGGDQPKSVEAFEKLVEETLSGVREAGNKIGGETQKVTELLLKAVEEEKKLIILASKSQKPAEGEVQEVVGPLSGAIGEVVTYADKNKFSKTAKNHLTAIADSISILGENQKQKPSSSLIFFSSPSSSFLFSSPLFFSLFLFPSSFHSFFFSQSSFLFFSSFSFSFLFLFLFFFFAKTKQKKRVGGSTSTSSFLKGGSLSLLFFFFQTKLIFFGKFAGAASFWTNKILTEFKGKNEDQLSWANKYVEFLKALPVYIKDHHTTGLSWNPKGTSWKQNK